MTFKLDKYNLDEGFWFQDIDNIFETFKMNTLDYDDKDKRRVFIDNGGKILLMAHLDTVLPPKVTKFKRGILYGQGFDDRLGCIIAYKLSQILGCDLLLTDNEESGQSTAMYHDLKDKYNWIVEFDRAGNDVVTYDIDTPEWLIALEENWKVGYGSFSDICWLDCDVCCVNIGIGYYKSHSHDSFVVADETNTQIAEFLDFYNKYKDVRFDFDYVNPNQDYRYKYNNYLNYNKNYNLDDYKQDNDYEYICDVCGQDYGNLIYGYYICETCFKSLIRDAGILY